MDARKLSEALKPLGRGEGVDGKKLDIAEIAARTHSEVARFARQIEKRQRRTRSRLRGARYIG